MSSGQALVAVSNGWAQVRRLALNAVSSPITRAMYAKALDAWWEGQGRPPFARAAVQAHRAWLEERGYSASTINQRLAAIRKLAAEAAERTAGAGDSRGNRPGARARNSGIRGQGTGSPATRPAACWRCPDAETLKGKRDRAMLGLLVGCGLRRDGSSCG